MDAVPVTLGQEFAGYAAQVRQGAKRVEATFERLGQVPLGGTAVGTGLNTHPDFAERVRVRLRESTGLPVAAPADPFEAQAARDGLVEASGAEIVRPVASDSFARTRSANSGCVFRPVPVAVPPSGICATWGSAFSMRRWARRICAA